MNIPQNFQFRVWGHTDGVIAPFKGHCISEQVLGRTEILARTLLCNRGVVYVSTRVEYMRVILTPPGGHKMNHTQYERNNKPRGKKQQRRTQAGNRLSEESIILRARKETSRQGADNYPKMRGGG